MARRGNQAVFAYLASLGSSRDAGLRTRAQISHIPSGSVALGEIDLCYDIGVRTCEPHIQRVTNSIRVLIGP